MSRPPIIASLPATDALLIESSRLTLFLALEELLCNSILGGGRTITAVAQIGEGLGGDLEVSDDGAGIPPAQLVNLGAVAGSTWRGLGRSLLCAAAVSSAAYVSVPSGAGRWLVRDLRSAPGCADRKSVV